MSFRDARRHFFGGASTPGTSTNRGAHGAARRLPRALARVNGLADWRTFDLVSVVQHEVGVMDRAK